MRSFSEGCLTLKGVCGAELGDHLPPRDSECWQVVLQGCEFERADGLARLPDLQSLEIVDSRLAVPFPIRLAPSVFSVRLTRSDGFLDLGTARHLRELRIVGGEVGAAIQAPRLRSGDFRESTVDLTAALAKTRAFSRIQVSHSRLLGSTSDRARCRSLTIHHCTAEDWTWLSRLECLRYLHLRGSHLPPVSVLSTLPDLRFVQLPGNHHLGDLRSLEVRGVRVLAGRYRQILPRIVSDAGAQVGFKRDILAFYGVGRAKRHRRSP